MKILTYQMPWIVGIILLSLQSISTSNTVLQPTEPLWNDKVIHFLIFGCLGILIARGMREWFADYLKVSLLVGVAVSVYCELLQIGVDGRSATLLDAVANIVGVSVFIIFYLKGGKNENN